MTNRDLQVIIEKIFTDLNEEFPATPVNLYEPIRYTLEAGGKRMRPLLVLTGAALFTNDVQCAVPSAQAVELFHNFSLLHDDIMDNAPLRRGNPTVHAKWNANIAILSGDAMYTEAFKRLAASDKEVLPQLLNIFTDTALQVCEGQQLDMDYETADSVTIGDYLYMIELKTAVLLAASLKMGAIAAGADEENAQLLYEFGKHVGLAFQLQDDILDVYGHSDKFGKQPGGDIVSNKKTFLLLKAFELANKKQKAELQQWVDATSFDSEQKVTAVRELYDALEVRRYAELEMRAHYEEGVQALENVNADPKKKAELKAFTDGLMNREW